MTLLFCYEDLKALRKQFGCYGHCRDGPLADHMKEVSKRYADFDKVRISYCFEGGPDKEEEDPRVEKCLADHFAMTNEMWWHHERALTRHRPRSNIVSPALMEHAAAIEASTGATKVLERLVDPSPPPIFNMLMFDLNHDKMSHLLIQQDFDYAALGLAFFNSKFSDSDPYILVEAFGNHTTVGGNGKLWKHSNFTARPLHGGGTRLFFVEVYDCNVVHFCCILDEVSQIRGCEFCPDEVIHPAMGGYLGGSWPVRGQGSVSYP